MKISRPVLKTSGYREVLAEFNPYLPTLTRLGLLTILEGEAGSRARAIRSNPKWL